MTITGGVLGDRAIDADGVKTLASLPSREVLLAKLAGGMQSPVATLAGLLAANIRNLGYALAQVRDQKAAGRGRVTAPRTHPTTDTDHPAGPPAHRRRRPDMAVLTQDDLLEAIDKMTVLELSEFIKRFEERYGVTAAAPVAVAAAPAAGGGGGGGGGGRGPRSRPSSPRP